jgi:hypothetical protein
MLLEVKMQAAASKSACTALPQTASSAGGDPDADRAWSSPGRVARSRRASQARNESGRRRLVDPTTCERDYSAAEMEFMHAIQTYKQKSGRMFPTWSEVLEVLQNLGYQKNTVSEVA